MKRIAMTMAMAMLMSAGITRAAQETVAAGPASPVHGGKVIKAKTMTAAGTVKTVTADSPGDQRRTGQRLDVRDRCRHQNHPAGRPGTLEVTPVSPVPGGKVIPSKSLTIADIKEGQRVQVKYRNVNGKLRATQVRLM